MLPSCVTELKTYPLNFKKKMFINYFVSKHFKNEGAKNVKIFAFDFTDNWRTQECKVKVVSLLSLLEWPVHQTVGSGSVPTIDQQKRAKIWIRFTPVSVITSESFSFTKLSPSPLLSYTRAHTYTRTLSVHLKTKKTGNAGKDKINYKRYHVPHPVSRRTHVVLGRLWSQVRYWTSQKCFWGVIDQV